jgi:hypothetical protein
VRVAIFSTVITHTSIGCTLRRCIAGTVTVCLVSTGLAQSGLGSARAQANTRVSAAGPDARPANDHFLRDSIPATSFAADPPDTTSDDFVLPEEKSKKQLAKEIAVWVIAAAFVAFFIVKVFIEQDDEPPPDDDGGKDIPPPE